MICSHKPLKEPARHLDKQRAGQKLHEKSTHKPWLKLSEGANSAKKIRTGCKMQRHC